MPATAPAGASIRPAITGSTGAGPGVPPRRPRGLPRRPARAPRGPLWPEGRRRRARRLGREARHADCLSHAVARPAHRHGLVALQAGPRPSRLRRRRRERRPDRLVEPSGSEPGPRRARRVEYANRPGVSEPRPARHLGVDRWLVPPHPYCPDPVDGDPGCRVDRVRRRVGPDEIREWLDGLDWVLFIERPYLPGLAQLAREMQVGVACVPNWEWLGPRLDWLSYVDLMICPTRHTHALALDWRRRYGFGWETRLVPWPVDTDRFRFVQRNRCERFVFANGWGGKPGRRLDGSITSYGRKGLELIVAAARGAAPALYRLFAAQEAAEAAAQYRAPPRRPTTTGGSTRRATSASSRATSKASGSSSSNARRPACPW